MQQIQWNTKYNISVMLEEELKIFPSGLIFVRMRACMINSAMGHTHANVLSWDFLEVPNKNPLQRLGLPWQRRPGPSRSVDHPTQRCLPFVARRQWAAAGERDRQPEPDTGSSQSYTKQTAELWHFPPCWKTISTVIKGELNRLISSKVTEQPPLPPPPPFPFLPLSHHPLFLSRLARWRPSMKCHQISGGLEVIGQKMLCWMCSRLKGKALCFVFLPWSMEGSSQGSGGRRSSKSLFKLHPYFWTGAFRHSFLCAKQNAYIDFMHVCGLASRRIGVPLNIWEITIARGVFPRLKSSAGNQYHAKKRAVNSMSCDLTNWKKNKKNNAAD